MCMKKKACTEVTVLSYLISICAMRTWAACLKVRHDDWMRHVHLSQQVNFPKTKPTIGQSSNRNKNCSQMSSLNRQPFCVCMWGSDPTPAERTNGAFHLVCQGFEVSRDTPAQRKRFEELHHYTTFIIDSFWPRVVLNRFATNCFLRQETGVQRTPLHNYSLDVYFLEIAFCWE